MANDFVDVSLQLEEVQVKVALDYSCSSTVLQRYYCRILIPLSLSPLIMDSLRQLMNLVLQRIQKMLGLCSALWLGVFFMYCFLLL